MSAIAFYLAAGVAVVATIRVITHTNPVHALLFLVISLIAVAMSFFSIGAPLAGALEIIVYAGAIMVLFVFVVMLLNLGDSKNNQEKQWLTPRMWIEPSLLSTTLLVQLIFMMYYQNQFAGGVIGEYTVSSKEVGISLFGPYVMLVELSALLLLAALVAAFHLGRSEADKI